MSEHYDIYLKHPVSLPEGTSYAGTYTDGHKIAMLSFEVAAGKWTKAGSNENGLAFSEDDRTVSIPRDNILLVEVWED